MAAEEVDPWRLSTIPSAAKMLGIPQRTIYGWVDSRRVDSWRVGSNAMVDLDQLQRLARARMRTAGYLPKRLGVNRTAVADAAVEWSNLAAVQWCAGQQELAAAYAVCAFFAWLAVRPAARAQRITIAREK